MKFFSMKSGSDIVFGAPGGGSFGVGGCGGATGAGGGGGGGGDGRRVQRDRQFRAAPFRRASTISFSKVMNFSCAKRTR